MSRREITLINKSERSWLERAERITKILAYIAIPVVLVVMGQCAEEAIKSRELDAKYVEIAVKILNDPGNAPDSDAQNIESPSLLRQWAIATVNEHATVKFTPELINALEQRAVFIDGPVVSSARSRGTIGDGPFRYGRLRVSAGARANAIVCEARFGSRAALGGEIIHRQTRPLEEPVHFALSDVEWQLDGKVAIKPLVLRNGPDDGATKLATLDPFPSPGVLTLLYLQPGTAVYLYNPNDIALENAQIGITETDTTVTGLSATCRPGYYACGFIDDLGQHRVRCYPDGEDPPFPCVAGGPGSPSCGFSPRPREQKPDEVR